MRVAGYCRVSTDAQGERGKPIGPILITCPVCLRPIDIPILVHPRAENALTLSADPTVLEQHLAKHTDLHLLSVSEVADRLGITRQAVLQRIECGSLVARRVGHTFVISASSIEAVPS